MAYKSQLIFPLCVLLTACGSSNDDAAMNDLDKSGIQMAQLQSEETLFTSEGAQTQDKKEKIDENELKEHPLHSLLTIENYKILKYLGPLEICDLESQESKSRCDQLVQEAVKKCHAAGFDVSADDFYNRSFQLKQLEVREASRQFQLKEFGNLSGVEFMEAMLAYEEMLDQRLEDFKQGRLHGEPAH